MYELVTILGGPKHGRRISVPEGRYDVKMFEPPMRVWDFYPSDRSQLIDAVDTVDTVSYHQLRLQLGPARRFYGALHPDITYDTGCRLLADLVAACWYRHGATR